MTSTDLSRHCREYGERWRRLNLMANRQIREKTRRTFRIITPVTDHKLAYDLKKNVRIFSRTKPSIAHLPAAAISRPIIFVKVRNNPFEIDRFSLHSCRANREKKTVFVNLYIYKCTY